MSVRFIHSHKLTDLWMHICEKEDDVQEAERAFGNCCNRRIDRSAFKQIFELLTEGSNLKGDYFFYQSDNAIYLFNQPTESAAYNAVLQAWRANTGRKTKKKGT